MKPIFNRAPLTPNTLSPLPLGSIRPEDWLLEQLQTQRDGLTAGLDERWADLGPECGWLGGPGDCGENAPYYLDGLVALAWTLDDGALKAKAMGYIEWILASQRDDGWFGPEGNDDYWPLMIALKALRQYFTASNDRRVLVLMDRFFKYQVTHLNDHPLKEWAVARVARTWSWPCGCTTSPAKSTCWSCAKSCAPRRWTGPTTSIPSPTPCP